MFRDRKGLFQGDPKQQQGQALSRARTSHPCSHISQVSLDFTHLLALAPADIFTKCHSRLQEGPGSWLAPVSADGLPEAVNRILINEFLNG